MGSGSFTRLSVVLVSILAYRSTDPGFRLDPGKEISSSLSSLTTTFHGLGCYPVSDNFIIFNLFFSFRHIYLFIHSFIQN